MKLKRYLAAAAACAVTAVSAALPVSATFAPTEGTGTAPSFTTQPMVPGSDASVPTAVFTAQSPTSAGGGAVLGDSTQTDSASTGDTGVIFAVAGLFLTAGIGAAAVTAKLRKK